MHKLKVARILNGLTQWDISVRTGIPASKISLIERGYISLKNLKKEQRETYLTLLGLHKKRQQKMYEEEDQR
jgi:transcriptional regulator with XRE-family HTH domain